MTARKPAAPPAPLGRRERRKHLTRRDLLVAGRRMFGEIGLYESRIEDLTRHAGIAKGTIYGYFSSKEELLEAVVSEAFSDLLAAARTAAGAVSFPSRRAERVVRAHLEFFDAHPDLVRVFHQVRGLLKFDRPEAKPLRAVLAGYLDGLGLVLFGPAAAETPAARRRAAAQVLFGGVSGVYSIRAALAGPGRRSRPPSGESAALVALIGVVLRAGGRPARRVR